MRTFLDNKTWDVLNSFNVLESRDCTLKFIIGSESCFCWGCLFLLCWDRTSCSSGWPQTHNIAEDEFLITTFFHLLNSGITDMEYYVQQHLSTDPATAPRNFKCQVTCKYTSCENKCYAIILLEYSEFSVSLWIYLF